MSHLPPPSAETPQPPTIGEAESRAWMATRSQLQHISSLVDVVLTLTGRSVEVAAGRQHIGQTLASRVTALLIVRIMNDLRAALHDARIGYPVQSVALVTGLYEMAATVAFIGAE